MPTKLHFDFVIIGSGMGGSAMAYGLKDTGASILILERGDFLPQEPENWDTQEVSLKGRYRADEQWLDRDNQPIQPRVYYNVGGNTKVYGAAMLRYREQDFLGIEHEEGHSMPWPITYQDLRPYYDEAEHLLGVHGQVGEDPLEPPRDEFPFPAMPHEPVIEELAESLRQQGLHPFHLPVSIDFGPDGKCVRCQTCDGFPCQVQAKGDAETSFLRPALRHENVTLWTKALVERLIPSDDGKRVERVEIKRGGQTLEIWADTFILSAGSINSPALLLKSKTDQFPNGLANNVSGLVGRNYMAHNNSVIMAISQEKPNPTHFQKTLALNDFYLTGSKNDKPLGHIQMRGKILPEMLLKKKDPRLTTFNKLAAEHSIDLWLMSEDLPNAENRVHIDGRGKIHLIWEPNNVSPHETLVETASEMMRQAGYPIIFAERRGVETISHQCGTLRFGDDPNSAVLDPYCRSFELPNLYVVDTSFYPSSAAVNPALTLAAQALRVAEHLSGARG